MLKSIFIVFLVSLTFSRETSLCQYWCFTGYHTTNIDDASLEGSSNLFFIATDGGLSTDAITIDIQRNQKPITLVLLSNEWSPSGTYIYTVNSYDPFVNVTAIYSNLDKDLINLNHGFDLYSPPIFTDSNFKFDEDSFYNDDTQTTLSNIEILSKLTWRSYDYCENPYYMQIINDGELCIEETIGVWIGSVAGGILVFMFCLCVACLCGCLFCIMGCCGCCVCCATQKRKGGAPENVRTTVVTNNTVTTPLLHPRQQQPIIRNVIVQPQRIQPPVFSQAPVYQGPYAQPQANMNMNMNVGMNVPVVERKDTSMLSNPVPVLDIPQVEVKMDVKMDSVDGMNTEINSENIDYKI